MVLDSLRQNIAQVASDVATAVTDKVDEVKESAAAKLATDAFSSTTQTISDLGTNVSNAVAALPNLEITPEGAKNIANNVVLLSNPITAGYAIQAVAIEATDKLANSMSDEGLSGYAKQALLAGNEVTKLVQEFEHATAYSAIQSPIDGIQQLANWGLKEAGLPTLPPLQIIDAHEEAEFNTPMWYAQTLGTGAGIVVGFVATQGMGTAAMAVGRGGQVVALGNAVLGAERLALGAERLAQVTQVAAKIPGLKMATTGFAYGLLTMPATDVDAPDFIQQRLKNGVVTAASGALVHLGGGALSQAATNALPAFAPAIRPLANAVAGYGTGVLNAELNSVLEGHGLTTDIATLHKEGLTWAVMGLGSEAAGLGVARAQAKPVETGTTEAPQGDQRVSKQPPEKTEKPVRPEHTVSEELKAIFTPEEIARIYEVKDQQRALPKSKLLDNISVDIDALPPAERPAAIALKAASEAKLAELADIAYGSGAPNKEKILHIIVGPPGAGKSTILVDPLAKKHGAFVIDSDFIKPLIEGYEKGLGTNAVHGDSAEVARRVLDRAFANGDAIVYPQLGRMQAGLEQLISRARSEGYKIGLHLADLPPEASARRVFERAERAPDERGIRQMVDPEFALHVVGREPLRIFENIIKIPGMVDMFSHFDTHVDRGVDPILVKESPPTSTP